MRTQHENYCVLKKTGFLHFIVGLCTLHIVGVLSSGVLSVEILSCAIVVVHLCR